MKIIFPTDKNLRKLSMVYNYFGGPDSIAWKLRQYAQFLGNDYYTASLLKEEINLERKDANVFWGAFLEKKTLSKKLKKVGRYNTLQLLKNLKIPMLKDNDKLFVKLKNELSSKLKNPKKQKEIKYWVKKIFGFELPRKIFIVLSEVYDPQRTQGGAMSHNPFVINLAFFYKYMERQVTSQAAVTLHEILHLQIQESKILKEENKGYGSGDFEEALIGYFVPGGVLASKLDLLDKTRKGVENGNPEEVYEQYQDRYFSKELKRLLPAMKKYYKVCGKITVWEFLNKNGFNKMINQKAIKKLTK